VHPPAANFYGVDVIFATHNGARTLPLMLTALRRLESPRRPWRILAIDNASTDDTPRILAEAAKSLPLVVLSCPEPGKVPALKIGAARASGDLVVFTDDDVEPEPGWLAAYEAAADAAPPTVGVFGGPIRPKPMEPVSPWYEVSREHHAELFARSDEPDGPVDAVAHVFGPNFMIRRAHLDVLDAIAPGLGPTFVRGRAESFAMGEDTEIMALLARRGADARYVRAAAVSHLVRGFQTELSFMLARAQRHGRGTAIRLVEEKGRSLARRARLALRQIGRGAEAGAAGAPPSPETFASLWDSHWARGALRGALFGPYSRRG
jgi:glucosyl-dolichyl phosphate glucuronosyltransferase